jgi:hypothetical protein
VISTTGRRLRVAAVAAVLTVLGVTTVAGSDDHFPLGPMSMFARRVSTDGVVRAALFRGRVVGGEERRLGVAGFGLRRAEVEGLVRRLVAEPALMAELAVAWERHNGGQQLAEIRLIHRVQTLKDGVAVASEEKVLATWTRS